MGGGEDLADYRDVHKYQQGKLTKASSPQVDEESLGLD